MNTTQVHKLPRPEELARFFKAQLSAEIDAKRALQRIDSQADGRPFVVLDVRDEPDYEKGHVQGAKNVPARNVSEHLDDLPKDHDILIYCHDLESRLSAQVALALAERGYQVQHIIGGWDTLRRKDAPISKGRPEKKATKRTGAQGAKATRTGSRGTGAGQREDPRERSIAPDDRRDPMDRRPEPPTPPGARRGKHRDR